MVVFYYYSLLGNFIFDGSVGNYNFQHRIVQTHFNKGRGRLSMHLPIHHGVILRPQHPFPTVLL